MSSLASGRLLSWRPPQKLGQLELPMRRERFQDRNADKGGRSFYFFDFDDNIAFLSTSTYIFHKETGQELAVSSGEFAQVSRQIGESGPYRDFKIDLCEKTGTFRAFRDQDITAIEKLLGHRQMFVKDLASALGFPDLQWKGPSWDCFYHATLNQRPITFITARGHDPETILEGVDLLVEGQHIPHRPNILGIYPVTNKKIRSELGDVNHEWSVARLKKAAIRASVQRAVELYGYNPHHRFGMSDDDPHNIELIVEEMSELKREFPEMSFFVIETQNGHFTKYEVYSNRTEATVCAENDALGVFEQLSLIPFP